MKLKKKIKLLVVDDSVLFRSQIQLALKDIEEIEIVGTASNGRIAIDKMLSSEVDLITLDLEMPVLDGIETLKEMRLKGMKQNVILFSSMSKESATRTLEAMRLGAIDFVAKPMPDGSNLSPADKIKEALLPKILSLYSNELKSTGTSFKKQSILWETFRPEVLVIASSTGGPNALAEFFKYFDKPVSYPILIAQHMPPVFTASLAENLAKISGKVAKEGQHGEALLPNQIYIAPGNFHMKIVGSKFKPSLSLDQNEARNFVRPCADFLFETAAEIYGRNTLGVVLTGMGRDGADGAQVIKQKSGCVLIQNQESSVVFGMPGAVYEAGHFDFMGTPQEIALKILTLSKIHGAGHVA